MYKLHENYTVFHIISFCETFINLFNNLNKYIHIILFQTKLQFTIHLKIYNKHIT